MQRYGNMLFHKNLSYTQFKIAFWVISYKTSEVITCLVPKAAGNYQPNVLMHPGMKQNAFSYILYLSE